MTQVTTFNNSPFFDDFNVNNNFYRVLFRPGYSVQTRELNQLQSILQQQISHISDFSVADKSAVIGGNINFNKNVDYLKLELRSVLSYPISAYSDGVRFKTVDGISGKLILAMNDTDTGQITLYVHYDKAAEGSGRHYPNAGEQITLTFPNEDTEVLIVSSTSADYKGFGTTVFLNESVYYIKNTFVQVPPQALILSKYNSVDVENENYVVGVLINEETISPEEDFSLYDNAYGTPNETAPGAYRYKITGVLIDKSEVPENKLENFIELKRLEKGEIANKPREESSIIPMLEQMLARRTYDESGDYIVDTFNLDIREHLRSGNNNGVYYPGEGGDTNKFVAQLDPGVGYIRGYEARIEGITRLAIDKARDTKEIKNNIVQLNYSNYVIVKPSSGDVAIGAKLNFYKAGDSLIGSGIIAGVETVQHLGSNALKLYLININSTSSFYDIKNVKIDSNVSLHTEFIAEFISHNITNIYSSLVYPLSYGFSKSIEPRNIRIYKTYPINNTTGNTLQISTSDTNETLSSAPKDYYVYIKSSGFYSFGSPVSVVSNTNNSASLNISNLLVGHTGSYSIKVIATSYVSNPTVKSKTLKTITETFNTDTDIVNNIIKLSKADGFRLISVKDDTDIEINSKFTFDTGGRDTHYDKASLIIKAGQSVKSNNTLTVVYEYFEHSIAGEFFTVNSYNISQIDGYKNIPTYVQKDGSSIFLGSAIDFRKILNSNGSYEILNTNNIAINEYITLDATYYLPRKDRIMITSGKNIVHIKGNPDFNPMLPEELTDAITLYNLDIYPYTFTINDVEATKLTHKRYTMKDIGSLERRIKNVEEIALLNKLESDVANINFEDRFKSGYVVDNFSTSNTGDVYSEHFGVAYDIKNNEIRPKVSSEFIDLIYNNSSNIKIHENTGIATLDYDVEEFISQPLASNIINVQPYINYYWGTGTLELSPMSDIWKQEFKHTEWIYTGNTTEIDKRIVINNDVISNGDTNVVTRPPVVTVPQVPFSYNVAVKILSPINTNVKSGNWQATITYTDTLGDANRKNALRISALYQTVNGKKAGVAECTSGTVNIRHGETKTVSGTYSRTDHHGDAATLTIFGSSNMYGSSGFGTDKTNILS